MDPKAVTIHRDAVFNHQTLHLTGHVYERCTFNACTLIYRGTPSVISACSFDSCVWHIDLLIHDPDDWDSFYSEAAHLITKTLPRKPA